MRNRRRYEAKSAENSSKNTVHIFLGVSKSEARFRDDPWRTIWNRFCDDPKGATITKDMFLNHLYGGMDEPEPKIIDVFISKLRKKLLKAGGSLDYIGTVWGHGYVLREPVTQVNHPVASFRSVE